MPISGITIAQGGDGYIAHNSRATYSHSQVFFDEKNETTNTPEEAWKTYRAELKSRSAEYTKRTRQKIQKKAITHLSAIVNLEKKHKLEDLQKLIQHLEKTLDTRVFQASIHRDEGKLVSRLDAEEKLVSGIDFFANPKNKKLYHDTKFQNEIDMEKWRIEKNYHAHIEFMGLDGSGSSVRRKLTKKYLIELQTQTAKILKMQRGAKGSKSKRLDTHEFKRTAKKNNDAVKATKATKAQWKKENAALRAQLQEAQAQRTHYAKIEAAKKELEMKIKAKDITYAEAIQRLKAENAEIVSSLKQKLTTQTEAGKYVTKRLKEVQAENTSLSTENQRLDRKIGEMELEHDENQAQVQKLRDQSDSLRVQVQKMRTALSKAEQEIEKLQNTPPVVKEVVQKPTQEQILSTKIRLSKNSKAHTVLEYLEHGQRRMEALEKENKALQAEVEILKNPPKPKIQSLLEEDASTNPNRIKSLLE